MSHLIDINELFTLLESRGLVIVSRQELLDSDDLAQRKLERMQAEFLKKPALTFKQVIDAQLLTVTTKQGIVSMIDRGKFKPGEIYENKDKRRMILTSAIKRLRYGN